MSVRGGINGFGRIGCLVLRACLGSDGVEVVGINAWFTSTCEERIFLEYLEGRELPGVTALTDASLATHAVGGT
jgi:glyceraldehyde-3-phosphate dehydrogenase/erythrose-4-phosphate dehydrogenase